MEQCGAREVSAQSTVAMWKGSVTSGDYSLYQESGQTWAGANKAPPVSSRWSGPTL